MYFKDDPTQNDSRTKCLVGLRKEFPRVYNFPLVVAAPPAMLDSAPGRSLDVGILRRLEASWAHTALCTIANPSCTMHFVCHKIYIAGHKISLELHLGPGKMYLACHKI